MESASASARRNAKRIDAWALLFSVLVSGGAVCGTLVYERIYLGHASSSKFEALGYAAAFLVAAALLYFLARFVFARFKDAVLAKRTLPEEGAMFGLSSLAGLKGHIVFLCLCWLPFLLVRFPGNLDIDTLWQLLQTHGMAAPSNHHPWFDTLLFSLFWAIGDACGTHAVSIFLYAALQVALTAFCLSVLLCYLSFLGIPKAHVRVCKLFLALYPAIPLFAQTMAKDMLFAPLFVLFCVLFCETCRTRGRCASSASFKAVFIAVCLLMMLAKKTGVYIAVLSFIPLLFICGKKLLPAVLVLLVVPLSLFLVWDKGAVPAMGVVQGSSAEMMSVPSQQTAFYLQRHQDEMSQSDWETLRGVFNSPEELAQVCEAGRADATKSHWKSDSTTQQKIDFGAWYLKAFVRHPQTFLLAALCLTLPIYSPDAQSEGDESLVFYRDNLKSQDSSDTSTEDTLLSWSSEGTQPAQVQELVAGVCRLPLVAGISAGFNTCYQAVMNALSPLFSKCLFAWWIPLAVLALLFKTGRARNILAMLPFLVMLLTLIAGPICLPRYMAPFVYVAPLLYGLLFLEVVPKEAPRTARHQPHAPGAATDPMAGAA